MAQVGKENQQNALPVPKLARKESIVFAGNALSSSKIPLLSKSGGPPERKQLHQQQSWFQQTCASSCRSKAIKNPKGSAPGDGSLEPAAALLPKSLSREPLGEVQLSTSGQRNEGSMSDGKGESTVEFVPDVAALASILSNTGLTSHTVSATHKPSLAGRVPLKGNRVCSASAGTARGSLYTNVPEGNLVRFSCISKSTSKADSEYSQSCDPVLNTQLLKTLSNSLKNIGPRVEAAKPRQTAQDLGVCKSEDPAAKPSPECLTRMTQAGVPLQSSSTGTKEATGSSWKDEEFVPDPAAKASILSNEGLSRFALGAHGKLSLAQRVPVKSAQKPPISCSSTRGESGFLRESHMRLSSIGKFGRVSCCSTRGLKGLKKSEASGAQLTNTPGDRLSAVDCSPYTLARRVPISCPQSLRPNPRKFYRVPLSSCRKDRRVSTQHPTEKEVKLTGNVTPQMVTEGSKQDDTAMPWGKIAVRLFDDEVAASAKKLPTVPVITPEMRRLQCIELLAQFLQQEMNNGAIDRDVAPSLEELHKLLSAHCSPAQPVHLSTPSQDPRPNFCKATPLSTVVAPETSTALITPSQDSSPIFCKATPLSTVVGPETDRTPTTTSSQPPICPSTSVHLAQPTSSSANSSGKVKQRLDDLLRAPQRFHEACLNDECAFYTARIMSASQPSGRQCKDPVAKTLDSHDAMYFIPISAPLSPVDNKEKPASS